VNGKMEKKLDGLIELKIKKSNLKKSLILDSISNE